MVISVTDTLVTSVWGAGDVTYDISGQTAYVGPIHEILNDVLRLLDAIGACCDAVQCSETTQLTRELHYQLFACITL